MKCIIIDDEPLARKGMELLINKVDFLEVIGLFPTALEASNFLSKNTSVDLVFLDIEMPGLNGLEFLKAVPINAQVILTTAYPQYALEAFELDVVDYLLKPIKFERFFKSINKARDIYNSKDALYGVERTEEDFFYIKADRKFIRLFFDEISYIKGMKDYVMICTDDKKYMTAMNVGTTFKQLPHDRFARVSKSYIIHIGKITQIDTDFIYLGDVDIPLGASYKEDFINDFVKKNLIGR